MPRFFIDRPVFAWVVAIAIILAGLIAIPQMPIARYPTVAPTSVTISAVYPGATPQSMNDNVVGLIERELSSVRNLLYFESSADTSGVASITATFRTGTNPDLAQVDVQNRLKAIEARLPLAVRQSGLVVDSASSGFLMMVDLRAVNGRIGEQALADYMARNVVQELKRVPGVGKVQMFGAEGAMRVWVDPAKLGGLGLTLTDVTAAIAQQNIQIAPGAVGAEPTTAAQRVTIPLTVEGQLSDIEDFRRITLRARTDGASVTLGDVARVEFGSQSYASSTRANGKPSASLAIQLTPGANAVAVASAVHARIEAIEPSLPPGMAFAVPFDTAPFVRLSIEKVVMTLIEAMVLVFLVMFLFLQKIRYTLIPAIVAPIALLGTFAVMLIAGFSINVLTMFGMVLAIGIIVDDAIVVVEAVERLMANEGLSPRDATRKAMDEITGAVIGITLVLSAVFIPMAFASGTVGAIYRQFSIALVVSILFSAFLALSLTPALCATLLVPIDGHAAKKGFFGWFDRAFLRMTNGYKAWIVVMLRRSGRMMAAFAAVVALLAVGYARLPAAFLPEEDQGYFMTSFQMPADSTAARTLESVKVFEQHIAGRPGIEENQSILGFGFSGSGSNVALAFTIMKDWNKRNGATAQDEVRRVNDVMAHAREGTVMSVLPPAIDELGNASGFSLRLQDRGNLGENALLAAQTQLLALAGRSQIVADVRPDGLPPGNSVRLEIDRQKAQTLGVPFGTIADTLSTALGSNYVNDFPSNGRVQQVVVQADAPARMQLADVLKLQVRNAAGGLVPLSELVSPHWITTPLQLIRYNGYPALRIAGSAAPGQSSGTAQAEMEALARRLPRGFAIEWSGQSLEEKASGTAASSLLALSMMVVFLVLAALYESWAIPLSVMLVVPLGMVGAVAAVWVRNMPNDVIFRVGLITIIGLAAKNAILIVEYAKLARDDGRSLVEAAMEAASLRLRPILMTSLAFTLGVVPLMLASGASAATQAALGTGVFGGMISATLLAVFFVPVFFVVVLGLVERWRGQKPMATAVLGVKG